MKKSSKKPVPKAKKAVKKVQATKLTSPKVANTGLVSQSPKINGIDEWTVRDAVRTIQDAEAHKKNKKLMSAVKNYVQNLNQVVGAVK